MASGIKEIIMETSSKNNDTASTLFINFLGLNNYKSILNTIFEYAKKNFQKFCALFSAFTFILFWYIKALAYCYQSGLFHAYNISSYYINISDNFFLQLIEYLAISTIILLSNLIFISIHIKTPKKWVRFIKKLLFFIIETISLFFIIEFLTYSNIKQILLEIKGYNIITYVMLLLILICCIISINIFAIEIIVYSKQAKPQKKKHKKAKENTTSVESFKTYIIVLVITAIIIIPLSYFMGVYNDRIRTSYKIVLEDISNQELYSSEYEYQTENSTVHLYAVVYENEDIYIVCPLYHDSSQDSINKKQTKIIEKNNITTFQCDNIKKYPRLFL